MTLCDLLVRAGQGDREAFAGVYDESVCAVYRLALCLTREPDRAADLVRRGYLEAWRTAPRFDPRSARPLPWLLATVQRVAVETHVGSPRVR